MFIPTIFSFLLFASLTVSFEIPADVKASLLQLHDRCIQETGAKLEHLRDCKDRHIPDHPDAKCYLNCMIGKVDVNLEEKLAHIVEVKHVINDDIHDLVHHLRKECDEKIHSDDKCDQAWQRANCHLNAHDDTMEFCILLMFQD